MEIRNVSSTILSTTDIEDCRKSIQLFRKSFNLYCDNVLKCIHLFANEDIVESFALSGNFGSKQIDNLNKINGILKKNNRDLDVLIDNTNHYLDQQAELNQMGDSNL